MKKRILALTLFSFGMLLFTAICSAYLMSIFLALVGTLHSYIQSLYVSPTPTQASAIEKIFPYPLNVQVNNLEVEELAKQNLAGILAVDVPENDRYSLAEEYQGIQVTSKVKSNNLEKDISKDTENFWVLNIDTNKYREVEAVMHCNTPHLIFWAEEGLSVDTKEIQMLCDEFETKIYPTNREFFGSEWTPGVDNDVRLHILYARDLGGAAGYFSTSDTLLKAIDPYSNEKEMFYLSADYLTIKEKYTLSTLAHEFQHMIHWFTDRNESSWINEGLSELASHINGYDPGGFDYLFSLNPDINLTFWPGSDQGDSGPHYGASYLFMSYLLNRFGTDTIKQLVSEPANGIEGLEAVLRKNSLKTGENTSTPEDVFIDWTIANLINSPEIDKGVYAYSQEQYIPLVSAEDDFPCDDTENIYTVNPFGTDYYHLGSKPGSNIHIHTNSTVSLLQISPYSGNFQFWSNRGDESHMQMWREFDFQNVKPPIKMTFWTWFDIEKDYDYAYLTAQLRDQQKIILDTSHCTNENPTGANYGCGINGKSQGWVKQTADLSQFAGKNVRIAFEYITDSAVNGDGLLIDDIAIEAIGYSSNFEQGGDGWESKGFVRVSENVPQQVSVSVVQKNNDGYSVYVIHEYNNGDLEITLPITQTDSGYYLAISALNRVSNELTTYSIRCTPAVKN